MFKLNFNFKWLKKTCLCTRILNILGIILKQLMMNLLTFSSFSIERKNYNNSYIKKTETNLKYL